MALSEGTKEAVWLAGLLEELKVKTKDSHVQVFSDSMSALKLIANPVFHERTKHIAVRHHFIREKSEDGSVKYSFIPTSQQVADSLTKALPQVKTEWCRENMGVQEIA